MTGFFIENHREDLMKILECYKHETSYPFYVDIIQWSGIKFEFNSFLTETNKFLETIKASLIEAQKFLINETTTGRKMVILNLINRNYTLNV